MQKFKQIIFLYLSILSILLGCVNSNLGSSDVSSAMFTVDEVTGDLNISKQTALPKTFTLKLSACIRSRLRNQPLPFTDYAITHKVENFNEYKKSEKSLTDIKLSSNLKTKTGKEIIRVKTDGNGCLHWTEEFDYAYYNQSQWIIIDRYIQGLSTGWPGITGNIPVAINPWLQLSNKYEHLQVVDYREKYGHKEDNTLKSKVTQNGISFLQQQKKQEAKNKVNIIIDKLNFHMEETDSEEGKQIINAYIKAKVNYTIKDILDTEQDNQINTGDFILKPILLIKTRRPKHLTKNQKDSTKKNIKQYFILNEEGSDLTVNTTFRNHQLVSDAFTWTIPYADYSSSSISLYMEVIPQKQTADRINSFEGIYSFGPIFKNIAKKQQELKLHSYLAQKHYTKADHIDNGSGDGTTNNKPLNTSADQCLRNLLTKTNLRYAKVITKCVQKDKPDGTWDGMQDGGWTLDPLEINYVALQKENWLFRKISTEISTFVRNPLFSQTVNKRKIHIKVIDLSTGKENEIIDKETANNGQIKFNVSTEQYWYRKQRYILKIIHFYTGTKEIDVKKTIAINPWDYGWTHGFEVNQVDDVRSTCLKNDNQIKQMISILNIKDDLKKEDIPEQQLELISQAFCHIPENSNQLHPDKSTWIKVITFFKEVLQSIVTNRNASNKLDKDQTFAKQFTSTENIPAGRSYIHLFRSINKFPTLLIDHSLNRSLFYNLRIKLTPRVVRMDSLNRGQQDKGPLRDGVYVLQMALLKNKQERQNGRQSGAMNTAEFTMTQPSDSISHTDPLYDCSNNDFMNASPDCITKEDFLIPPVNIPVITRDGIIRTDIALPIARENLMFANSKNILVFRILPADPYHLKCKDKNNDSSDMACANNKSFDLGYDWEQSLPIIRPAHKELYDMIFYTYKTPFIPSLWNNWTIARETTTFSNIEETYSDLTTQAKKLKNEIDSEEKQSDQFLTKEHEGQTAASFNKMTVSNEINKDKHETLAVHEQLNQKDKIKTNIFDTSQTDNKKSNDAIESNNANDPASSINCPTVSIGGNTYPVLPKNSKCKCLPAARHRMPIKESAYCANQRKQQSIDLSDQHITQFAADNALCVIPINSSSHAKNCGDFESPQEIEQYFIQNLNRQIDIINTVTKKISTQYAKHNSDQQDIKDTLINNHTRSKHFRDKLNALPALSHFSTKNIVSIIKSGINNSNMDINKLSFLHALCGFWFEKFYTAEYTDTELLEDALKKTIKNTFYYKLRGMNPLPTNASEENNNTSEENSNHNINQAMNDLKTEYKNYLQDMNLKGYIDDVHNWVNGQKGYGFDSNFYQKIKQKLTKVSKNVPFKSHTPSWEKKWFFSDLLKKEKKEKYTFNLSHYLNEAKQRPYISNLLMEDISQPLSTDRHPVRKCINNPSHFFGFERKIISGQTGLGIEYQDGKPTILNVTEDFMINSQRDQGSSQDFAASMRSNLNLLTMPLMWFAGATGVFAGAFVRGINLSSAILVRENVRALGITALLAIPSAGWSYRTYEGTGKRKMVSYRVGEQVELYSDHTTVTIPLIKYHQCLVIRPRFSAFESYSNKYEHIWADTNKVIRSMYESIGMLLCTEGKEKTYITEDYYYIYPNYPLNRNTMDSSSFRNKPFTISLRGKSARNKFISDLNCWITGDKEHLKHKTHCQDTQVPYEYLLTKRIEFVRQLHSGFIVPKLFHQTQISPGVHSPDSLPIPEEERDISSDPSLLSSFLNWMAELSFMESDIEKFIRDTPQDDD